MIDWQNLYLDDVYALQLMMRNTNTRQRYYDMTDAVGLYLQRRYPDSELWVWWRVYADSLWHRAVMVVADALRDMTHDPLADAAQQGNKRDVSPSSGADGVNFSSGSMVSWRAGAMSLVQYDPEKDQVPYNPPG